MRFKIKLLHWPDTGHHALVIIWGRVNTRGLMRVFDELARLTESLPSCKILMDFEHAELNLDPTTVDRRIDRILPQRVKETKIALVSAREKKGQTELIRLRNSLSVRGLEIAVFDDPKDATAWLSDRA